MGGFAESLHDAIIQRMKNEFLNAFRQAVTPGNRKMFADALLRAATEMALEEQSREDYAQILRALADELSPPSLPR